MLKLRIALYQFAPISIYLLLLGPFVFWSHKKVDIISAIIFLCAILLFLGTIIIKKKKFLLAVIPEATKIKIIYLNNVMRKKTDIFDTSSTTFSELKENGILTGRLSLLMFKSNKKSESYEVIDQLLLRQTLNCLTEYYKVSD